MGHDAAQRKRFIQSSASSDVPDLREWDLSRQMD